MNHISNWGKFFESKSEIVTTTNLRRYLDSEIPDVVIGKNITNITVKINERTFKSDLLIVSLIYVNKSIDLIYKIKKYKLVVDYLEVVINNNKWIVRTDSNDLGNAIQSHIFLDLLKSEVRYEDIENIDNLIINYLKNKKISYESH